jgi:hypothetical protein
MGVPAATINLSASTERQWLGIVRPKVLGSKVLGSKVLDPKVRGAKILGDKGRIRMLRLKSRNGMTRPAGIPTRTRRRAIAHGGYWPGPIPVFTASATMFRR